MEDWLPNHLLGNITSPYHHITDGLLFNPMIGSFSGGVGGSCSTKTRGIWQKKSRIPKKRAAAAAAPARSPPWQKRYDRNVGYTHKCVEKQKQS